MTIGGIGRLTWIVPCCHLDPSISPVRWPNLRTVVGILPALAAVLVDVSWFEASWRRGEDWCGTSLCVPEQMISDKSLIRVLRFLIAPYWVCAVYRVVLWTRLEFEWPRLDFVLYDLIFVAHDLIALWLRPRTITDTTWYRLDSELHVLVLLHDLINVHDLILECATWVFLSATWSRHDPELHDWYL